MSNVKTAIASAPANTMLMGEHAVLFGYKALVCALKQRIFVQASIRDDDQVVIDSSLGHFSCKLGELSKQMEAPTPFAFVLNALAISNTKTGLHLRIESGFNHTLGLGSSAAVTVAVIGVMALLDSGSIDRQAVMKLGIKVIQKVQGSGSGADVAASSLGGVVEFEASPPSARNVFLSAEMLAKAPELRLVYCGYKTPTPIVINKVATAAKGNEAHFKKCYAAMGECVDQCIGAIKDSSWHTFADAMNLYQHHLRNIGVSDEAIESIIDLGHNQAHSKFTNTAVEKPLFGAKISGSGLGDCVLIMGAKEIDWPHQQIPLVIDSHGVREETLLPSQAGLET